MQLCIFKQLTSKTCFLIFFSKISWAILAKNSPSSIFIELDRICQCACSHWGHNRHQIKLKLPDGSGILITKLILPWLWRWRRRRGRLLAKICNAWIQEKGDPSCTVDILDSLDCIPSLVNLTENIAIVFSCKCLEQLQAMMFSIYNKTRLQRTWL